MFRPNWSSSDVQGVGLKEPAALLLGCSAFYIFDVNASEYSRLYYVIVPLSCTCLVYVCFVGLLAYPFILCVVVLNVTVEAEACCCRPAIAVTRGKLEYTVQQDAAVQQCSVYSRYYTTNKKWEDIPGPFLGQRFGKHVPAATNQRATMEVRVETGCFYVVRVEELQETQWGPPSQSKVRQ
jgi:hypothetical protein